MNSTKLYPGMCDGKLEFFFNQKENKMMAILNGQIKNFEDLKEPETNFLLEIIESDEELKTLLNRLYPGNLKQQKERLAKCRFGGLNFEADFCNTTKQISCDMIDCPIRNSCEGNGIICKPLNYDGNRLSNKEIDAIRLLATIDKNTTIAEKLEMPIGTFNVFRTNLYGKLKIETKQEATRVGVYLGIV